MRYALVVVGLVLFINIYLFMLSQGVELLDSFLSFVNLYLNKSSELREPLIVVIAGTIFSLLILRFYIYTGEKK